eukprot:TRINITY_DN1665_c0_g1_i2.p2 TRINITY_DN1665_c0_g1~~TRINITY_DN1665_c0_g1_i2.p2  ORF type:complete len:170 (+),score=6.91 TRINITY_DN1665_c0_g1_i2:57-566(+)
MLPPLAACASVVVLTLLASHGSCSFLDDTEGLMGNSSSPGPIFMRPAVMPPRRSAETIRVFGGYLCNTADFTCNGGSPVEPPQRNGETVRALGGYLCSTADFTCNRSGLPMEPPGRSGETVRAFGGYLCSTADFTCNSVLPVEPGRPVRAFGGNGVYQCDTVNFNCAAI